MRQNSARPPVASKLDDFKPHLKERMKAGAPKPQVFGMFPASLLAKSMPDEL
jgi:hypothetical protein